MRCKLRPQTFIQYASNRLGDRTILRENTVEQVIASTQELPRTTILLYSSRYIRQLLKRRGAASFIGNTAH